jgi:hypothetical protein
MLGLLSALLFPAVALACHPRVLVYTRTVGFRHPHIPIAIQVLGEQQAKYNVTFVFSECVIRPFFHPQGAGVSYSTRGMV